MIMFCLGVQIDILYSFFWEGGGEQGVTVKELNIIALVFTEIKSDLKSSYLILLILLIYWDKSSFNMITFTKICICICYQVRH